VVQVDLDNPDRNNAIELASGATQATALAIDSANRRALTVSSNGNITAIDLDGGAQMSLLWLFTAAWYRHQRRRHNRLRARDRWRNQPITRVDLGDGATSSIVTGLPLAEQFQCVRRIVPPR